MTLSLTKKILSGLIIGATTLTLVACSTNSDQGDTSNSSQTSQSETKEYKNIAEDSSFVVTKDKKVVPTKEVPSDAVVIDWYMDPFCPACAKLETLVQEQTKDLYQEGVYIRYHVLSFLDKETQKGSSAGYSVRTASYINAVAEYVPDKAVDYLNALVNLNFRPDNGEKTDEEFKEAFTKIGGTEEQWENIQKVQQDFIKLNKRNTTLAVNDKELNKRSSSGQIFIPFILIGPDSQALDFETETDSVEYLLSKIKTYKEEFQKQKEEKAKADEKAKAETSSSSTSESSKKE
jgi:DSBA oxidoreductase